MKYIEPLSGLPVLPAHHRDDQGMSYPHPMEVFVYFYTVHYFAKTSSLSRIPEGRSVRFQLDNSRQVVPTLVIKQIFRLI